MGSLASLSRAKASPTLGTAAPAALSAALTAPQPLPPPPSMLLRAVGWAVPQRRVQDDVLRAAMELLAAEGREERARRWELVERMQAMAAQKERDDWRYNCLVNNLRIRGALGKGRGNVQLLDLLAEFLPNPQPTTEPQTPELASANAAQRKLVLGADASLLQHVVKSQTGLYHTFSKHAHGVDGGAVELDFVDSVCDRVAVAATLGLAGVPFVAKSLKPSQA
ncbi:hypothetical protein DFJ73DRAFT_767665 [Zopfochytrium polystomum]|nr:hypothetical protein DFJ73DRAFT_767665 [Zopfochytrium polystomum]